MTAEILNGRGVRLESTRTELARAPHNDAIRKKFTRERRLLPEGVMELQNRIRLIKNSQNEAIANHDFEKARAYLDEERKEREKLHVLCQQHGLLEWLFT